MAACTLPGTELPVVHAPEAGVLSGVPASAGSTAGASVLSHK